ncbi:MAG: cation:proton antiporter [Fibromonadaceae bacterium]|jgi:CPA2 family monovalent cation:H+ antiporter-2|nr:cation:proton antiporter [Fibromonadaceae bacterium]
MHDYDLILLLALGFAIALVFGYITQKLRLSPILGYLLAGVVVSPNTPGINVDKELAAQLSEVGVILLLFGVGLHFTLKDLLAVKRVSVPGAVVQSLTATALATVSLHWLGYSWGAGLIIGMSISVASTVVLIRVLSDNNVLNTSQGHIAVGWLVVEDIFTVLMLVMLPVLSGVILGEGKNTEALDVFASLAIAVGKMGFVAVVILLGGKRFIPWLLMQIARTRSRELFTLAVLAIALLIATGAYKFGASFALGAFFAGMVVGQSKLSEQAAADALPMKDAFAVIFFVAVGMLFDPVVLVEQTELFLILMGIILVAKPLAALVVVIGLGYSTLTAFTVAIALSQIGEFSFILSGEARKLGLVSSEQESTLIAAAILSLALNPLWFRFVPALEKLLGKNKKLWSLLNWRASQRIDNLEPIAHQETEQKKAIIVGYGPVGEAICKLFKKIGVHPVVIDMNIDTIAILHEKGIEAVFGDASKADILGAAGVEQASYLIVTPPDLASRIPIAGTARNLNENITVYSRARYITEWAMLEKIGVSKVCYEEAEAAAGIAKMLLQDYGASDANIIEEIDIIREKFRQK